MQRQLASLSAGIGFKFFVVPGWLRDPINLNFFLLTGGYERFSSEYPEFCSKTKTLAAIPPAVPPSTAESLDLGCSSCGTPLHDQVCGGFFSEFCFQRLWILGWVVK